MTYYNRKIRFFSNLLVVIASLLSLCAAYCTVSGLYSLFGKATMVAVIVAFIEMARVSAVYTLHEFWYEVRSKLKWLGIIFVTIGTIISSAGIMGFFANSYGEMTFETAQLDMKSSSKSGDIDLSRESIKFEQENLVRLDTQLAAERETYNKLKTNEDGSLTQQQRNAQHRINNLQKEINIANKNIRAEQAKISGFSKDITEIKQESFAKSPELAAFGIVGKAIGIKDTGVIVWALIIMVTCIFDLFAIFLWIWSSNIRRLGDFTKEEPTSAPVSKPKSSRFPRLFHKKVKPTLTPTEIKPVKTVVKPIIQPKPVEEVKKEEIKPQILEVVTKNEVKTKTYKKKPSKNKKLKKKLDESDKQFIMSSIKEQDRKIEEKPIIKPVKNLSKRKDLFSEFTN